MDDYKYVSSLKGYKLLASASKSQVLNAVNGQFVSNKVVDSSSEDGDEDVVDWLEVEDPSEMVVDDDVAEMAKKMDAMEEGKKISCSKNNK